MDSEPRIIDMAEDNKNLSEMIESNERFKTKFDKAELSAQPTKHIAILTCMDCRMNPYEFAGLREGEAHIIRNAGGRVTDDAIRSLVVSHKLLGTLDWFIVGHTDCGMSKVTDEVIGELLETDLETASLDQGVWINPLRESSDNTKSGSSLGKHTKWYTFNNLGQTILDDIDIIKKHPLVPSHIKIYGLIFDVHTGKLLKVS